MTENYHEYLKDNKVIKHAVNGFSRFFILWCIKYNESIHGYGIIQELDDFYNNLISEGSLKKYNTGKIYPILKDFEKSGLIAGEWKNYNNQKVKYYQITKKGEFILQYIFERVMVFDKNPKIKLIYDDLSSDG